MQHPVETYLYAFVFSLTGYMGVNVVLTLVKSFGALPAVTGENVQFDEEEWKIARWKVDYENKEELTLVNFLSIGWDQCVSLVCIFTFHALEIMVIHWANVLCMFLIYFSNNSQESGHHCSFISLLHQTIHNTVSRALTLLGGPALRNLQRMLSWTSHYYSVGLRNLPAESNWMSLQKTMLFFVGGGEFLVFALQPASQWVS